MFRPLAALLERLRTAEGARARHAAALAVRQEVLLRESEAHESELLAIVREIAAGGSFTIPARTEWVQYREGGEPVEVPAREQRVAEPLEEALAAMHDRSAGGLVERALEACSEVSALAPTARRLLDALRRRERRSGSVVPPTYMSLSQDGTHEDVDTRMRIVFLGDFTRRADPRPVNARGQVRFDRGSLDQVLAERAPALALAVPDVLSGDGELHVQLRFGALSDFEPAAIAAQVPEIVQALGGGATPDVHGRIAAQLDAILHHPSFQALESAWRTLRFVADRQRFGSGVVLMMVQATKDELERERDARVLSSAVSPFGAYLSERYLSSGGSAPLGLFVGLYELGPDDTGLLARCASVASDVCAPFVVGASPAMLGASRFRELADPAVLRARLERPEAPGWRAFRDHDDARFAGLCLPRFLLREPYADVRLSGGLVYDETLRGPEDHLWGNAAAALATRVAASFARHIMGGNIVGASRRGGGLVEGLPGWRFARARDEPSRVIPTEVPLSERSEYELSEAGFIGLTARADGTACFLSANSCRRAREGSRTEPEEQLVHQLPYTLYLGRVAHCLQRRHHETCHYGDSPDRVEATLREWLEGLVTADPDPPAKVRMRFPFQWADIAVRPDGSERFRARLSVRPHFRYMGAHFTLSIEICLW